MRKLALCLSILLYLIPNISYATDETAEIEAQKKFEKAKTKIEKFERNENFKSAIKQIYKLKEQNLTLNKEQQKYIDEKEKAYIEEWKRQQFFNKYVIENDPYLHLKKYYSKNNFTYINPVLIVDKNNRITINVYFNFSYTSNNWVNINSLIVKYDDNTYNIPVQDHGHDVHCSGYFCTYYEFKLANFTLDYKILKDISNAAVVTIRAYGNNTYRDFFVSRGSLNAMANIVNLREYLITNKIPQ